MIFRACRMFVNVLNFSAQTAWFLRRKCSLQDHVYILMCSAILFLWPNKEICMTWSLESTSAFTFVVSHHVQIRKRIPDFSKCFKRGSRCFLLHNRKSVLDLNRPTNQDVWRRRCCSCRWQWLWHVQSWICWRWCSQSCLSIHCWSPPPPGNSINYLKSMKKTSQYNNGQVQHLQLLKKMLATSYLSKWSLL